MEHLRSPPFKILPRSRSADSFYHPQRELSRRTPSPMRRMGPPPTDETDATSRSADSFHQSQRESRRRTPSPMRRTGRPPTAETDGGQILPTYKRVSSTASCQRCKLSTRVTELEKVNLFLYYLGQLPIIGERIPKLCILFFAITYLYGIGISMITYGNEADKKEFRKWVKVCKRNWLATCISGVVVGAIFCSLIMAVLQKK